jgi:hypothetical protein
VQSRIRLVRPSPGGSSLLFGREGTRFAQRLLGFLVLDFAFEAFHQKLLSVYLGFCRGLLDREKLEGLLPSMFAAGLSLALAAVSVAGDVD